MAFFVPQQTSWGMIRALLSMESFALCGAGDRSGSTFFPAYFVRSSRSGDVPPCGPPVNVPPGNWSQAETFYNVSYLVLTAMSLR